MKTSLRIPYFCYYQDDVFEKHLEFGREVWFAGGAWSWIGMIPSNRYTLKSMIPALDACREKKIKNVFFTMWGDNGGECPYASALAGLMYAAALAEGMDEAQMKAKFKEITGEDYDAFLELDLPNYIYGPEQGTGSSNYSKNRLYNDPFLGIVDA